ncbi:MAG: hypothetical protein D6772_02960, partial [Bacteroidetes bacterium]
MFQRLYPALIIGVCLCLAVPLYAQRLVSTDPAPKRAVLEEFGGIYCVYCPHGHQIIRDMEEALEESFISLNYQVGAYAVPLGQDPDLRTDYGAAIAEQSGLSGYPAATVNRLVFPGMEQGDPGTTALNRSRWTAAVQSVLQQTAPVNIAIEASLNITTLELEVYLEYYYTTNAEGAENRLHLAVLQNNVLAPQHGGAQGAYYVHQHLVRDFLTGADGHRISSNTAGAFGSLTYRVTLPNTYRDIWVDPVNIELVAFITEDTQNILNGVKMLPALASNAAADANLLALKGADDTCGDPYEVQLLVRNDGQAPLTSLTIDYGLVGGLTEQYYWTGDLGQFETTSIDLPSLVASSWLRENEAYAVLRYPNGGADPTLYNNERTHTFTVAPIAQTPNLELAIRTDEYGYELYWEIVDDFGEIYASGGNQVVGETDGGAQIATAEDPGAYPSSTFLVEEIELPTEGCYQLRVLDDFADGLCCYYGNGFYQLRQIGQSP